MIICYNIEKKREEYLKSIYIKDLKDITKNWQIRLISLKNTGGMEIFLSHFFI